MTLRKPLEPPPDADARMVGRCAICGASVEVAAWEASQAPVRSSDPLADLRFTECPTWLTLEKRCGSKVYLMPKVE